MSTNKTENLGLHSWEPDDPFRRAEINENFAAIDANAGTTWAELTVETAAREGAVSALQSAVDACGNCVIETGSYTGDGGTTRTLIFSVMPDILFIRGDNGANGGVIIPPFTAAMYGGNDSDVITYSGNSLTLRRGGFTSYASFFNASGVTYRYVALVRKVK